MAYLNKNHLEQFNYSKNIGIAICKQSKAIDGLICYDYTNKEPVLSLINSIYWNGSSTGKRYYSGDEITKAYKFIKVDKDNFDLIKETIKSLHYHLNNLTSKGNSMACDLYENRLFGMASEYKKGM